MRECHTCGTEENRLVLTNPGKRENIDMELFLCGKCHKDELKRQRKNRKSAARKRFEYEFHKEFMTCPQCKTGDLRPIKSGYTVFGKTLGKFQSLLCPICKDCFLGMNSYDEIIRRAKKAKVLKDYLGIKCCDKKA